MAGAASAARRRGGAAVISASLAAALLAAGCSPIVRTHGYAPTESQIAQISPGADTAATVAAKIGRPSTGGVIRDDAWYYVASRTEALGWRAPQVTERKVVAVRFDETGAVASIDAFGLEDGRVINLVTRTTPTFGRELTILQQLFGNLGNVGGNVVQQLNQ